jgi:hypothetical protein
MRLEEPVTAKVAGTISTSGNHRGFETILRSQGGFRSPGRVAAYSLGLMRFIGVDLAWTARGQTGLCAIEDNSVQASGRVGSDAELLRWLRPLVEDDVVVAIDAPLIVNNLTGGAERSG